MTAERNGTWRIELVGHSSPPESAASSREALAVATRLLDDQPGEIVVRDAYHRVVKVQRG